MHALPSLPLKSSHTAWPPTVAASSSLYSFPETQVPCPRGPAVRRHGGRGEVALKWAGRFCDDYISYAATPDRFARVGSNCVRDIMQRPKRGLAEYDGGCAHGLRAPGANLGAGIRRRGLPADRALCHGLHEIH